MQHHQLDELPNPNTSTSDPPIVLHVEDDHDFSAALRFRLEAHGVAVIRSEDGDNGIRRLLERKVDAVLLDYELPNRNGDEVIKSIRKIDALRELPIIVITGSKAAHAASALATPISVGLSMVSAHMWA